MDHSDTYGLAAAPVSGRRAQAQAAWGEHHEYGAPDVEQQGATDDERAGKHESQPGPEVNTHGAHDATAQAADHNVQEHYGPDQYFAGHGQGGGTQAYDTLDAAHAQLGASYQGQAPPDEQGAYFSANAGDYEYYDWQQPQSQQTRGGHPTSFEGQHQYSNHHQHQHHHQQQAHSAYQYSYAQDSNQVMVTGERLSSNDRARGDASNPELRTQIGNLNSKMGLLREEQKRLRANLAQKKQEIEGLNTDVERLNEDLRVSKSETETLRIQISNYEQRARTAEDASAKARDKAERLKEDMNNMRESEDRANTHARALEVDLEQARSELEFFRKQAEDKEVQCAQLREQNDRVDEIESEKLMLKDRIHELELEIREREEKEKRLQEYTDVLRAQHALGEDKVQRQEEKIEGLEEGLREALGRAAQAEERIQRTEHMMEVEAKRGKQMLTEMRSRALRAEGEIPLLRQQVKVRDKDNARLSERVATLDEQVEEWKEANRILGEEVEAVRTQATRLETVQVEQQNQLQDTRKENGKLKRRIYQSAVSRVAEQRDRVDAEVDKHKRAMAAMVSSRQDAQEKWHKETRRRMMLEDTIKSLKRKINALNHALDDAEAEKAGWSEEQQVMKAVLSLRNRRIARQAQDAAIGEDGQGAEQSGTSQPDMPSRLVLQDVLVGDVEEWLAADCLRWLDEGEQNSSAVRHTTLAEFEATRTRTRANVDAILTVPSSSTAQSNLAASAPLIWQIASSDDKTARLIKRTGIKDVLARVQGAAVAVDGSRMPMWQGPAPAFLANQLCDVVAHMRALEEWAVEECARTRKLAARAISRASDIALAGKEMIDGLVRHKVSRETLVERLIDQLLLRIQSLASAGFLDEPSEPSVPGVSQDECGSTGLTSSTFLTDGSHSRMTDSDGSSRAKSLLVVDLAGCELSDTGCHILTERLLEDVAYSSQGGERTKVRAVDFVTELDLRGNSITDAGAKSLAALIRGDQALTAIDLRGNHLTTRGMCTLETAVRNNSKLTHVHVQEAIGGRVIRARRKRDPTAFMLDVRDNMRRIVDPKRLLLSMAQKISGIMERRGSDSPKRTEGATSEQCARGLRRSRSTKTTRGSKVSAGVRVSRPVVARSTSQPTTAHRQSKRRGRSRASSRTLQGTSRKHVSSDFLSTRANRNGQAPLREARDSQTNGAWPQQIDAAELLLDEHLAAMQNEIEHQAGRATRRATGIMPDGSRLAPRRKKSPSLTRARNPRSKSRVVSGLMSALGR